MLLTVLFLGCFLSAVCLDKSIITSDRFKVLRNISTNVLDKIISLFNKLKNFFVTVDSDNNDTFSKTTNISYKNADILVDNDKILTEDIARIINKHNIGAVERNLSLGCLNYMSSEESWIPGSLDVSKRCPNCNSLIRLQEQENWEACWAFVMVGIMSDYPNGTHHFIYLPVALLTCYSKWENSKQYSSGPYQLPKSVLKIEKILIANDSLVVQLNVYDDIFNFESGLNRHEKGQFLVDHTVKILGWDTERNLLYWLINLSWGNNECEIKN